MANVHRIGDYQNPNDAGNAQRQVRMGGMGGGMFGGGDQEANNQEDLRNNPGMARLINRGQGEGDPRQESFWTMLKLYFCPTFTWKSFIFIAVAINFIMFIVSLALTDGLDNDYFLGIQFRTLCRLGAKDAFLLRHGQIHRWITPAVLHAGFMHILQNNIFLLIIGSLFEIMVQPLRFFIIYVLSAVGGILMSALVDDKVSVGASTALFGILGGLLAFLIVNWVAMESMREIRCCLLCFIIIILVVSVLFGLGSSTNVDNFGHLGGFVTGLPLSMALMPILATTVNRHQLAGWTYEKY